MDYVAVTLQCSRIRQVRDLLLPLDIPQYILVDQLIDVLEINVPDRLRGYMSVVKVDGNIERKSSLPLQGTLRDVGIKFGQYMTLEFKENAARLSLICLQGPVFDIAGDEVFIGCQKGLDVNLIGVPNQEYVSGNHAKIFCRNGRYYLIDMGSTNGTKVNGKVVQNKTEQVLGDGDLILLGATDETGIKLVVKLRK